ncbi:MAG: AAA family ATPase [Methanotrichaceae archaeon]
MRLNSLEMQNFKKYSGQVKIEFQDGLTGIVGRNGSGKSTIVEAVAWALYGNKASTIKRDFIKNTQANERQDVTVKLNLSLGDQTLTIFRAMKGKNLNPDAKLSIDENMVATGTREVDRRLEDILKISFQDFMKTFYARQKDLDNLIKEGGAKKKEYLLALLGLDKIRESALDLIRDDARMFGNEMNRLEGALSEVGDVEENIKDLKKKLASVKTELDRFRTVESDFASAVEEKRQDLERETKLEQFHGNLVNQIKQLDSDLLEKKKAISREENELEKIKEGKWQLYELEPKLARLEEVNKTLECLEPKQKQHQELVQSQIRIETELEGRLHAIDEIKRRLEALNQEETELESIRSQEIEYQGLTKELEYLERRRDLHRDLQSDLETLEDQLEKIRSIESRVQNLSVKKSDLKKEIVDLGDLDAEEADLKLQYEDLNKQESDLNKNLAHLNQKHAVQRSHRDEARTQLVQIKSFGAESNCPTCERPLGLQYHFLVKKYQNITEARCKEIENLEGRIQDVKYQLERVTDSRNKLKRCSDLLESKKSKRRELIAETRSIKDRITEQREEIQKIEEEIKNIGSLPQKLADLEKLKEIHEKICKKIEDLKHQISDLGFSETRYSQKRKRISELNQAHERFSALKNRVKEIPQLREDTNRIKTDADQLREKAENIDKMLEDLGFNPSEYETFLEEQKNLRKAEQSANNIKLALAAEERIKRHFDEASADAARLESDLEEAKKQLSDLNYSEERCPTARQALEDAKHHFDEARKKLLDLQVQVGVIENDLVRSRAEADRKKKIQGKIADLRKRKQVVDTTKGLINGFMDHILVKIRNDISINASSILSDVMAGKYSRLTIDEDFNILVEDQGEYYPISRYSGGEIDMMAVSVRVAISEYLTKFSQDRPGYSFLILDEVFSSQDVEHRDSMIDMLRSLGNRFPQIFAISHISEVQDQFDNTILVTEEDGSSRVEVDLR